MDSFLSLGPAVDMRRLTETLGTTALRGRQWVRDGVGVGHLINRKAPPIGKLNRSLVFPAQALNGILPEIREVLGQRHHAYTEPYLLDLEKIARQTERFEGIPHVLGFIDMVLLCDHFNLANRRLPLLWAKEGLLAEPAGILGGYSVWDVKDVHEVKDFIIHGRPQSPRRPARTT